MGGKGKVVGREGKGVGVGREGGGSGKGRGGSGGGEGKGKGSVSYRMGGGGDIPTQRSDLPPQESPK